VAIVLLVAELPLALLARRRHARRASQVAPSGREPAGSPAIG
jgi:hypothetical protein